MKRDGALVSLWQSSVPDYESKYKQIPEADYDVVIVGAGITGITTALLLQQAGKKCIVIEAHNICFGTTGGTTAHLNTLLDTPYKQIIKNFGVENAKLVATAAADALLLIKENVEKFAINCGFENASAFLFAQNDDQVKELDELYEASLQAGLNISYADSLPIVTNFIKAVEVKGQAKFNPVLYVYTLAKAFEEAGGIIIQHCRVNNAEQNEKVDIETDQGKIKASALIYATHIPPGINLLHMRCAPYRSYAMAIRLKNNNYPDNLTYDMYDPYHYYRTQKVNGRNYLIAGGKDHKTAHEENTNACFLQLENDIRKIFEIDEVVYKWSSQYFEPADGLPYIGHLPGQPGNIFVATGFGGNGMTYSNVAALLLTDLILNKSNKYTELFDPNRIKPIAGFANFIKENADVAKHIITGFFSAEKLESLSGISPGEGKIVKFEDHTIAIYKDEARNLHALNAKCMHMKCTVSWNNAEQSWDCPCHGARYDCDGKVLTGPSDRDMQVLKLNELIAENRVK